MRLSSLNCLAAACLLPGFWLSARAEVRYELTELLPLDGDTTNSTPSRVFAINEQGWCGGLSRLGVYTHATLWRHGQAQDAGALGSGYSNGWALNDFGTVVGQSYNSVNPYHQGFLSDSSGVTELGSLNGQSTSAQGINNNGMVVGWSNYSGTRAVAWVNGAIQDLGALVPTPTASRANAVNDAGVVVGYANYKACRWNGTWQALGTLGGDYSEAKAINEAGVIVGSCDLCPSDPWSALQAAGGAERDCAVNYTRAFRWENGQMTELSTPEGFYSRAFGLNDRGQIVGRVNWTNPQGGFPALWDGQGLHNLNEWIDPALGVVLEDAMDINNRGEIVCTGLYHGRWTSFLLSPVRPPVLVLPGIAGTYGANVNDLGAWAFTRGIEPAGLQIDPLGHFYDDLIQTLDNSGYTRNVDLFAANYDWRMVPGPSDEGFDGVISGLSAVSITDNVYEYGVDYLGHYLLAAMDAWEVEHPGDTLKEVDLIAHSTGGLVARTYMQSAAYNGLLPDGRRLPTVRNMIMVGVPNRGASKVWNPLHDDWGVDVSFQVVLSKMINLTFQKVLDGAVVTGPDYDIDLQSLLDCDEDLKTCFVRMYVPTLRSLLATYDFIDFGSGLQDVNGLLDLRNALTLDLNAGLDLQLNGDPNSFASLCKTTVIHATSEATPTTVSERQGAAGGEDALVSFDEFVPRDALAGEVWYEDLIPSASGDGTVPLDSSVGQFVGDARVTLSPYTRDVNTQEDVSHCGLMFNTQVQAEILSILGAPRGPGGISTSLHDGWANTFSTAVNVAYNIIGGNLLVAHLDPVEGFVVDGQGRRLGWSAATGALQEIPGSRWFGNGDGLGWSYGALEEPVTLQLTGQGAEHYAQVSLVSANGQSGLTSSGFLAQGAPLVLPIDLAGLETPMLGIAWSGPGLVQLSWNAVANATGYAVYGAPTSMGPWTLLQSTSGTSAAVTVLDDDLKLFRVRALN